MAYITKIRSIVYPARDLKTSIAAWSNVLGDPVFQNDNFASFAAQDGIDIGLSSMSWVKHPHVFFKVDDIEKAHVDMVEAGAIALGEVEGGTLNEIGKQPITNGDSKTGIVSVPGRKMANFKLADGSVFGLVQDVPVQW